MDNKSKQQSWVDEHPVTWLLMQKSADIAIFTLQILIAIKISSWILFQEVLTMWGPFCENPNRNKD